MKAFGILGFVFGLLAFIRLARLTETLKENTILEADYKDEQISFLRQSMTRPPSMTVSNISAVNVFA